MYGATGLDKLPVEIIDEILRHIDGPKAALSTISRPWQAVVEKHTFASIMLRCERDSLHQFRTAFSDKTRRPFLKELSYTVVLPRVSRERQHQLQSKKERARNNIVFTKALLGLFILLSRWGSDHRAAGIHLLLTAESPSDTESETSSNSNLHPYDPSNYHGCSSIQDIRNLRAYIELVHDGLPGNAFPRLDAISRFTDESDRLLHPDVFAAIFNALPKLREAKFDVYLPERRLPTLREDIRAAFGRLLESTSFPCLDTLTAWCGDIDPSDERFEPQDFMENGTDAMTVGVRRLFTLPKLEYITLTGQYILSPHVFASVDAAGASSSVKTLSMRISAATADGHWYFTGDPSEPWHGGDYSEDESMYPQQYHWERENWNIPWYVFRTQLDEERLMPLLSSMVGVVTWMPSLKMLDVAIGDSTSIASLSIRVECYDPNVCPSGGTAEGGNQGGCVITIRDKAGYYCGSNLGSRVKAAMRDVCDSDYVRVKIHR